MNLEQNSQTAEALAQRVQELEGMLGLATSFEIGSVFPTGIGFRAERTMAPVFVARIEFEKDSLWKVVVQNDYHEFDDAIISIDTPESAIRATREYIAANGGTLA